MSSPFFSDFRIVTGETGKRLLRWKRGVGLLLRCVKTNGYEKKVLLKKIKESIKEIKTYQFIRDIIIYINNTKLIIVDCSALIPVTSKAHRQKTSIKKRTLNPEFNEVCFIFHYYAFDW